MNAVTIKSIEEVAPYAGEHALEGIRFRAVREALGVSAWGMNVLELDPSCDNHPEHAHTADGHEEVYIVLRGAVVLRVDDAEHELRVGQLARVAPEQRRQLVTRSEGATVLALGGTPGRAYTPSMGG